MHGNASSMVKQGHHVHHVCCWLWLFVLCQAGLPQWAIKMEKYFKYKRFLDVNVNGAICTPPLEHMLGKMRPINAERDAILLFLKHLSSNCIIISMYSFCYCFHLQYLLGYIKNCFKVELPI